MRIKIITGFIPIPDHPRSEREYDRLAKRWENVPYPLQAFQWANTTPTWLRRFVADEAPGASHSVSDNPAKNTLAYHCVQHQKSEWLMQAAVEDTDTDVFVWIDYGIFHVPGVDEDRIIAFLDKVDGHTLAIPGCHGRVPISADHPCWRFCGGVVVAPRRTVFDFDQRAKRAAKVHIRETNNVEWEVNTWARAEQAGLKVAWYQADHNETMFTNYGRAECLEYA